MKESQSAWVFSIYEIGKHKKHSKVESPSFKYTKDIVSFLMNTFYVYIQQNNEMTNREGERLDCSLKSSSTDLLIDLLPLMVYRSGV